MQQITISMAANFLKQSSIHSFFSHKTQNPSNHQHLAVAPPTPPMEPKCAPHHTHKHPQDSNPESPAQRKNKRRLNLSPSPQVEAPMTEYERQRNENILKNKEFLKNLGIANPVKITPKKATRLSRTRCRAPEPLVHHLRRSTRRRPENLADVPEDRTLDLPLPPPRYDESSVVKYMCSAATSDCGARTTVISTTSSSSRLVGFRRVGSEMVDPLLRRIYTVDVAALEWAHSALVAAAGHGGRISIYGTSISDVESDMAQGPLMTWKGSASWISGVRFIRQGEKVWLLSASNDGGLVMWDIGKEPSSDFAGLGPNLAAPPIVAEVGRLHTRGIFGMHELNGRIATASTDSSVGFCSFRESEITVERTFSGHHYGPIRGICFRDSDVLADCGRDNKICVLDIRMANSCTLTIESDHRSGVNVVEWCPKNEFLVLSASKDPKLLLYDIRIQHEPLHKLEGHVDPNHCKSSQIYRPSFVGNGMAVATPGQGSKQIFLYSTDNGKAISRGFVGYDANLVMCNARDKACYQRVWLAGKQMTQLSPIWQDISD